MSKQNNNKISISRALILVVAVLVFSFNVCLAASPLKETTGINNQVSNFSGAQGAGFNTGFNITMVLGNVIQAFLGLLGIIFVILIILGGYDWMMARGDEEKVNKAKDTLTRAVIGLIITVGAYAISQFVISGLLK